MFALPKLFPLNVSILRGLLLVLALCCAPAVLADTSATQSAETAVERIPFKKTEDSVSTLLLRVLGGLIITALIALGIVYGLKRYVPAMQGATFGGSGHIKVIEVRRLTPKLTLFLIDVDGVRLLVSQNGDRVSMLSNDLSLAGSDGRRDV